jgi:superoxide dismutase, Fe-Mn family
MIPGGSEPSSTLIERISKDFGSFEAFKASFTANALGVFGSGWTWLVQNSAGKLVIENSSNAHSPIADPKKVPLLCVDIWEHAYYVDHQNRRPEFIENWWKVVDFGLVEAKLK